MQIRFISECGDVADESEENEGEDGGEGMGLSLFGAGIGNIFEAGDEEGKGIGNGLGRGYINLRKGKART